MYQKFIIKCVFGARVRVSVSHEQMFSLVRAGQPAAHLREQYGCERQLLYDFRKLINYEMIRFLIDYIVNRYVTCVLRRLVKMHLSQSERSVRFHKMCVSFNQ